VLEVQVEHHLLSQVVLTLYFQLLLQLAAAQVVNIVLIAV
jgi:hypothetical protein